MRNQGYEEQEEYVKTGVGAVADDRYEDDAYEDDDELGHSTPTIPARTAFRRFWPLTRGLRSWLLAIWLCTVLAALAETAAILLFGDLTDHALQQGSLAAFWAPAAEWLAVAVLGAAVAYAGNSLATWVTERFVMRLREHVFDHVQHLPPHFFQRHRQGDLLSRLHPATSSRSRRWSCPGSWARRRRRSVPLFYAAAAFWLR